MLANDVTTVYDLPFYLVFYRGYGNVSGQPAIQHKIWHTTAYILPQFIRSCKMQDQQFKIIGFVWLTCLLRLALCFRLPAVIRCDLWFGR